MTVPSSGRYPRRVAVNALRNMIYVANLESQDISVYRGEPGTAAAADSPVSLLLLLR